MVKRYQYCNGKHWRIYQYSYGKRVASSQEKQAINREDGTRGRKT